MEEPSYTADQIDERDWVINAGPSLLPQYLMYCDPVHGSPLHNYQLLIARCSHDASRIRPFVIFEQELYSVMLYTTDLEDLAEQILDVLQSSLIDNPVELAMAFGGTVRGQSVHGVRVPGLH